MATTRPGSQLTVGLVGLGNMGTPMAGHLAKAHERVLVTSLARIPEVEELGAEWVDTAYPMAEHCNAILFMVPDLPQVRESLEGEQGLLAGLAHRPADAPPLLVMIGSTASAVGVRELDVQLRKEFPGKIHVIDTPVTGGVDGASAATLSIMIGADKTDAHRAIEALAPLGTPVHLGPVGAGQVAKACNQLVVGATMFALGEATVLAERSGLDVGLMWDVLSGGYSGSRLLDTRKKALVDHDDAPSGPIKFLQKDVKIGLEIAAETGTNPVVLPALKEFLRDLVDEQELGERDLATTRRYIDERSARS